MKKRDIKNILIFLALSIYAYIYKNIILVNYLHLENIITSIFLIIISFISILLLGIRKTPNKQLETATKNLLVYQIIIFFLVTYGIGIFIGFLSNSYSLKLISIIKHIVPVIIFIVTTELLRYTIISANKDKKYPIVIITIIIIILELLTTINAYKTTTFEGIFRLFASSLIPLCVKHYMLSYISYTSGIKSPLIYRLIMDLYIYIAPIFPNFGESLQSITIIIFNIVIYLSMSKLANERAYKEPDFKTQKFDGVDFVYTGILLLIVALTSGLFKYSLIAVGSDSMSPTFKKGDAVLIDQEVTKEDIKEQDVVLFDDNGKTIIHRIVKIEEKNNIKFYYTRGDANNINDSKALTYEDIKGKVKLIVPYAGYPNILIEEYR